MMIPQVEIKGTRVTSLWAQAQYFNCKYKYTRETALVQEKKKGANEKLTCMNLYALRKRAELTQGDVAARCGVTIAAYSKWERGTAYPTTDKLPSLAAVFSVTINELFLPYADDLVIPAEGA